MNGKDKIKAALHRQIAMTAVIAQLHALGYVVKVV